MKLLLLSDLHNEFFRPKPVPPIASTDADVIVLAGDIDTGLQGLEWAASEAVRLDKPVIYVSGNHEYYRQDIEQTEAMRAFAAEHEELHFLENDELVIDGVRFLGCTLWTDYRAVGDPVMAMVEVQRRLNDHHLISNGEDLFLPEDALTLHRQSRAWLEEKLAQPFDGKTVVVTHHAPSLLCKHPSFPMDAFGTAFLSDLDGLVAQADIWCFGHTHCNLDVQVGNCRLVSNQRGYVGENVMGFDEVGLLEV
jgi:predicted phosphodiesterase